MLADERNMKLATREDIEAEERRVMETVSHS
jgi:hypothetical protein